MLEKIRPHTNFSDSAVSYGNCQFFWLTLNAVGGGWGGKGRERRRREAWYTREKPRRVEHRHSDAQTDRQRDRQTDGQTDRQRDSQTDRQQT
jgi:hypothetical protein